MPKNFDALARSSTCAALLATLTLACAARRSLTRPLSAADVQEVNQTVGQGRAVV
ncbi:MAG: hypothetical protein ABUS79_02400 [Pseudomonadota bacterium]